MGSTSPCLSTLVVFKHSDTNPCIENKQGSVGWGAGGGGRIWDATNTEGFY